MNITDVRVRKIKTEGKMKAVASITIDDCFVIHDIKIIEGHNGYFIAMPSRKVGEGDFKDIAHPINTVTRNSIQSLIFEKYEEENGEELPEEQAPEGEEYTEDKTYHEKESDPLEHFETEELGSATIL